MTVLQYYSYLHGVHCPYLRRSQVRERSLQAENYTMVCAALQDCTVQYCKCIRCKPMPMLPLLMLLLKADVRRGQLRRYLCPPKATPLVRTRR